MARSEITSFTKGLLREASFKNHDHLFQFLEVIPREWFKEKRQGPKAYFIGSVKQLIQHLEMGGAMVRETREMTRAGALFESMADYHNIIQRDYNKKRKQLREKLTLIRTFQLT